MLYFFIYSYKKRIYAAGVLIYVSFECDVNRNVRALVWGRTNANQTFVRVFFLRELAGRVGYVFFLSVVRKTFSDFLIWHTSLKRKTLAKKQYNKKNKEKTIAKRGSGMRTKEEWKRS